MGLFYQFYHSLIDAMVNGGNTILDYTSYGVFILYSIVLVFGVLVWFYNLIMAVFQLDKDKYVTGHRWQHINILALYMVATVMQYLTLILHILSHSEPFIDLWRSLMIGSSYMWVLYLYTVFNIYVLIHLEQELRGKSFVRGGK